VEVPTESRIAELLPELIRVVGGQELAAGTDRVTWGLGFPGRLPFTPGSTLAEQGVMDGALLALQPLTAWQQEPRRAASPENGAVPGPLAPSSGPRERTGAVLPEEMSILSRLHAAARAGLARAPRPEAPARGGSPSRVPAQRLTVPHRPSLLRRLRLSWRETDYQNQLERVIQAPQLRRCVTIAVMSPKGGVGKTTTTALLGALFAMLRRDRIVAVDTNPDFGSLGRSLAPLHEVFVDDLLEVLDDPRLTVTELDANLGRGAHGLMVLPSPTDPTRMARLNQEAYERVVRRLQDLVGVVLLDCGTGLHEPASQAALKTADQVLLVTDAEPATASLVAEAAALLQQDEVPIWLLVNKMPTAGSRLDLGALEAYIPQARGLVVLPAHMRAANQLAGGAFDWRDAPAGWKRAIREVAAVLVAHWPELRATI
jgi:MinD-like ATPase involved in chromosome partitioning or flagellar assembly